MTGPSAIGSENGTPTSITSAPLSCSARRSVSDPERSGWPAVTYVTSARLPCSRRRAKVSAIGARARSDEIVADTNAEPFGVFRLDDRARERAVVLSFGEVHHHTRMKQVAGGVADHANQRTRQHVRHRIYG